VREARLVATGSQQTGTASSDCPASAEGAPAFRHIFPGSLRHRLERRRQHARYIRGGRPLAQHRTAQARTEVQCTHTRRARCCGGSRYGAGRIPRPPARNIR
jgi:hypothetical protein